jgi:hypothetical protein
MSNERDPKLLELFSKRHQPIESECFIATVIDQIEREQRAQARSRRTVLVGVLIVAALAIPAIARYLTIVTDALTTKLYVASESADPVTSWLPTVLVSFISVMIALVWRTLRNTR